MKKNLSVVLLIILSSMFSSCVDEGQPPQFYQPHIGAWEDVNFRGRQATLVLRENGTGSILFDHQFHDFKYVMDYSKKPVWLDLIYSREGRPYRAKVIVQFLEINKLKWRTFFGSIRPTEFLSGNDIYTIILNRLYPFI